MTEKKSIYLIDGSSYIYRAFYALTRLTNARGMPTQAVYGFAQMLLKVLRDKKPDYVCVVFDAPGPTFRHEQYEPYKATRQKMPEDLSVQIPYIKQLVRCHSIPQIEVAGYEADDLIATLTHWAVQEGLEVIIVSGDKDLHQMVEDPRVRQWDPQKDLVFTEHEVTERFGISPRQMADYLALVGDSSDNVPGVKGVGDKTARQLLQQWGSLDEVFRNLDAIPSATLRKKLAENRDSAYLSKDLVVFRTDAPVFQSLEDLTVGSPLLPELGALYEELGFKKLAQSLRQELGASMSSAPRPAIQPAPQVQHGALSDISALTELVERIKGKHQVAIELHTSSRDAMRAEVLGIALSIESHTGVYVPTSAATGGSTAPPLPQVLNALLPLLSERQPGKLGHDLKHDWVVLKRHGAPLEGIAFDVMVASYLLDPGTAAHSIDRIAAEQLGEASESLLEAPAGKGDPGVESCAAGAPACHRAEVAWRLAPVLREKLTTEGLEHLYEYLELPLIAILGAMEYHGILVDAGRLEALSLDFEKAMDRESSIIYGHAKEAFNIQSPKQLAAILFEKLGLRVVKKTKTGPSTDMSVLEELAVEHPIVEHILAYRSLAKLKGTYTDALARLIHPQTGRIHTSFNQTVTATGRLSSSDPNLQNIPVRSEEGRKIRAAFVAPPGNVLLSADYSQIELRLLAHYSQDRHLLEAFHAGADVHTHTAAEMIGVPPHQVTSEMRRQAKTINFGIIYGMGAFGLAQRMRISNKMARAAIDRYFERYQGVKRFIGEAVEKARKLGYSETLLGRKRAMPELQSRNHTIRQLGERLAVNTPLQGTAADLIKKAMIDVDLALKKSGLKTVMLLQVHDELVFEVPVEELDQARGLIEQEMESVWELSVPLKVDIGWGDNWAAAHP